MFAIFYKGFISVQLILGKKIFELICLKKYDVRDRKRNSWTIW